MARERMRSTARQARAPARDLGGVIAHAQGETVQGEDPTVGPALVGKLAKGDRDRGLDPPDGK
jgi:hypothetical protein